MSIAVLTPTQKWSIFILYASKEEFRSLIKELTNDRITRECYIRECTGLPIEKIEELCK